MVGGLLYSGYAGWKAMQPGEIDQKVLEKETLSKVIGDTTAVPTLRLNDLTYQRHGEVIRPEPENQGKPNPFVANRP
jgi:hypothetical protein